MPVCVRMPVNFPARSVDIYLYISGPTVCVKVDSKARKRLNPYLLYPIN